MGEIKLYYYNQFYELEKKNHPPFVYSPTRRKKINIDETILERIVSLSQQ